MTRVRIGIASWNTAELLDHCLAALPAAAAGLDFDVVVVDNDSADDSVAVAQRHQHVVVVANPDNTGYARAMNQALRHDGGGPAPDVLIALNPDTVPPPGSLTELVARLLADPTVGLVVPQLANLDGSLQHSVYRFPSPLITFIICTVPVRLQRGRLAQRFWLEGKVPHDQACDIDWAIGAVHVMRAEAVGPGLPYNQRWFMYVEDMDLCWQLGQQGWRIRLEPSAHVVHVGNAAGQQAWGNTRNTRWWQATYDWVRFRRGVGAVHRYATINTIGVWVLLQVQRVRRRLLGRRAHDATVRINDLAQMLPLHIAMMRAPRTTFDPEAGTSAP
ncbi:MAG TPA: glycosyltransferase family 2 protein [Acidimicrobiales bacterium]|jgi:GT2 family glycosyltransferase|nr:glycosyltransferase family 2 protein [Acidimicrobiales bacterium]